jgi:hypothetical protein
MIIRNNLLTLDNSSLEIFAICPRKFWLRCVQHLVPKKQKLSLTFGGATHAGLYAYHSGLGEKAALKAFLEEAVKEGSKIAKYCDDAVSIGYKSEYSLEFGVSLMSKYIQQHPIDTETFEPMRDHEGNPFLEVGFALELEEGLYIGKIDGIGYHQKRPVVMEHKTTSQTVTNYIRWLNPNNQISGYLQAVREYLDFDAMECLVNILRIKDYKRGAPEDNDQKLFMRTIVKRSHDQVDARMRQINLQMKLIKQFLAIGEDAFYMNAPFACNAFGDCEYKPLCGIASGDPELVQMVLDGGYKKEEWHPYQDAEPKKTIGEQLDNAT